jgi:hypothetical protein
MIEAAANLFLLARTTGSFDFGYLSGLWEIIVFPFILLMIKLPNLPRISPNGEFFNIAIVFKI